MKKIQLFCVAFAATLMMISCDNKRESGSNSGTGAGTSQGYGENERADDRTDNENALGINENKDAVERAEDVNEERFDGRDEVESMAEFLVEVGNSGMYELQASEIAQKRATSPKVKDFAKHMVKEHSKTNGEVKSLASKKNVTLPAAIGEDHKEKIQKLNNLSGIEFDKEYMDQMVEAHKKDVKKLDSKAKGKTEGEVEAWAAKTLPNLQKHLEMAQQTEDELEKSK